MSQLSSAECNTRVQDIWLFRLKSILTAESLPKLVTCKDRWPLLPQLPIAALCIARTLTSLRALGGLVRALPGS